jgi:hypothetical protein
MKKKGIYFVILMLAVLFVVLFFNDIKICIMNRIIERELKIKIEESCRQNDIYKKRLHYVENDVFYFERLVREELELISPGEVEYRFNIDKTSS